MGIRKTVAVAMMMLALYSPIEANAQDKITIGFTAALTGDFAAYGLNMRKGAELALKQINSAGGAQFEITSADDRGEAREGVLIAQKFCSDENIDVVMGYSFSSIALAAVPVYDSCSLPVLASAVTNPDLSGSSKFFRRNILTDAVQGAIMGEFAAKTLGFKNAYVIHQQDDYGIGVGNAFSKAYEAAGGKLAGTETYVLGTKDFKTQLAKIKAAAPDGIFIGGFYTESAKIAQQAKELGLNVQLLGTDSTLTPELITLGKEAVEGMILYSMFDPSVETPITLPFIQGYTQAYGEAPNAFSALGYDAAMTLAEAVTIAAKSGEVTRMSLNDAFGAIKELPGVTGPTTFDENGDRSGSVFFLQVKGGKFAVFQ